MKQITGSGEAVPDGRSARWDDHRQRRRLELVKVARRAVHRLGPGAPMGDIAAAAATSKSVFYRYFGDKDGLRQAVGEVVIGQMRAEVLEAGRSATTAEEGLRAMVAAYLRMAETSPNVYFFVTADREADREAGSGPAARAHGEVLDAFFAEVLAMMRDGMQAYLAARGTGTPGGNGTPVSTAALGHWPRAALGMVRAVGESWLRQPAGPDRPAAPELTATLTGWLVHGIAGTHPQDPDERITT